MFIDKRRSKANGGNTCYYSSIFVYSFIYVSQDLHSPKCFMTVQFFKCNYHDNMRLAGYDAATKDILELRKEEDAKNYVNGRKNVSCRRMTTVRVRKKERRREMSLDDNSIALARHSVKTGLKAGMTKAEYMQIAEESFVNLVKAGLITEEEAQQELQIRDQLFQVLKQEVENEEMTNNTTIRTVVE